MRQVKDTWTNPPPPKLAVFTRAKPTPDDILLIAALVISEFPMLGLHGWMYRTNASCRKFWARSHPGVNAWVYPYYPKAVQAVLTARKIQREDPDVFYMMREKAVLTLQPGVIARATDKRWKQQYQLVAWKFFHNIIYKAWMRGEGDKPETDHLERLTGWNTREPFVPQSIIPWEDYQSGSWKSRLMAQDSESQSSPSV